jgi:hypothetical protein
MSWGKTILSVSIFGVTIAGFTTFKTAQRMHKFYYYPELNVYYNVQERSFLYSVDGGKSWSAMLENEDSHNVIGKQVMLLSSVPEVWKKNEEHRHKYGGYLVNLVEAMQTESKKTNLPRKKKPIKVVVEIKTDHEIVDPSHWERQYLLDAVQKAPKDEETATEKEDSYPEDLIVKEDSSISITDSTRFW